jgi:hypothetical protein
MTITFETATKNLMLEQIETRLKAGSTVANPRMVWYDGSTLLAQVALHATEPCAAATGSDIVLAAPASGTAWTALSVTPEAAGDCDSIQFLNRDNEVIITLTGADMGLSPVNLTTATPITFTAAPHFPISEAT